MWKKWDEKMGLFNVFHNTIVENVEFYRVFYSF